MVQNRYDAPGWMKLEAHTSFKMLISFVCLVQSQCVSCSAMLVLCHVNDQLEREISACNCQFYQETACQFRNRIKKIIRIFEDSNLV